MKKVVDYCLFPVKKALNIACNHSGIKEISYSRYRITPEALSRIIEETYARAYALMVYEGQSGESVHVNKFLITFLKSKFKNLHKTVNEMFCSIVYSAYIYKDKYVDCDIFYKFVSDLYHPLELNYFIFLR
jgi:hypothetical protein